MTSALPPIKIHFLDPDDQDDNELLTDVGVVNVNGERHLFLSPQSFYSAVRQVSSAMPEMTLEQVERLVREHCEFQDFDELLAPAVESTPPVHLPPPLPEQPTAPRPSGRAKKWVIAAALLPAFVGTWALGHSSGDRSTSAASSPDAHPSTSADRQTSDDDKNLGPEPFTAHDFMDFSQAGKIACSPIDNLEAECTDADGMVMATKAATGPDSTIFTFSYGPERLGLRIFGTSHYAATWTQQDGSRELYPNLVRSGRYVLWGTDKERLHEYLRLLQASGSTNVQARNAATTMGFADPLPPRLAALTLGTLGLGVGDLRTILCASKDPAVDAPVLMAAQAVLGVSDGMPPVAPGAEDIVALAAGLEPPPVDEGSGASRPSGHAGASVVPVSDLATSPNGGSASSGSAVPAADPKPTKQKPVVEQPVVEKPKDPAPREPTPEEPAVAKPETPPVAPVDPAPPVSEPSPPSTEPPPAVEAPDPSVPPPPGDEATDPGAEDQAPADEVPPAQDDSESAEDGGDLITLPQAWIGPAAA